MKRVLTLLVGLAVSAALAAPASAATLLFNNAVSNLGGTVTFNTTNAIVTNAPIDFVTQIIPPGGPAALAVTGICGNAAGGCLNITTGAFTGTTVLGTETTWHYNGGSVLITGATTNGSGALLTDAFSGDVAVKVTTGNPNATLQGNLGAGTLNALLASYFSVSPITTSGSGNDLFRVSFVTGVPGGTGTTTTQNQYQVDVAQVPEPGTMFLFGTGLVGLARFGRRRFRKG